MNHTGKHMLHGLLWLLGSEILCLILAFSLAILPDHPAVRIIGLIFGITAHVPRLCHLGIQKPSKKFLKIAVKSTIYY